MYRFEDQGLTLRLFASEHEAKVNSEAVVIAHYGPGVIARNKQGRWFDAHGVLPTEWAPDDNLLSILNLADRNI